AAGRQRVQAVGDQVVQPGVVRPVDALGREGERVLAEVVLPLDEEAADGEMLEHVAVGRREGRQQEGRGGDEHQQRAVEPGESGAGGGWLGGGGGGGGAGGAGVGAEGAGGRDVVTGESAAMMAYPE